MHLQKLKFDLDFKWTAFLLHLTDKVLDTPMAPPVLSTNGQPALPPEPNHRKLLSTS